MERNTQKYKNYKKFAANFCNFGCVASALGALSVLRAAISYQNDILPISYINEMTEHTLFSLAFTAAAAIFFHKTQNSLR